MHGNGHGSRMTFLDHHVVATLDPVEAKSEVLKGTDGLPPIHRREA